MLCRIARSSPRWRALEYGNRQDGSRGTTRHSTVFPARFYSSTRSDRPKRGDLTGTITTSTPDETNIDDILQQLPRDAIDDRFQSQKTRAPSASLLLLLLTPSYAQHALDPDLPLKVYKGLRESGQSGKIVQTAVAVVDRIPAINDDSKDGHEGLAYAWKYNGPIKFEEVKEMPPSAQKPGWLRFKLAGSRGGAGKTKETTLQVPLARTIFTNGKVSTLVQAVYHPDEEGQLQLDTRRDLESFRFDLQNKPPGEAQFRAPLVPLTPARTIGNVMGNIVRTLSTEPSFSGSGKESDETQPASEELEQAVTTYFTAANIDPQPVSVWALIIPSPLPSSLGTSTETTYRLLGSQTSDLRTLWSSHTELSTLVNAALNNLLPAGARLRKVLSGGGGWGKKAGLLSLDPDDMYSTRELREDAGWEVDINEDMMQQQRQALGEAAKKGESVMFFLAPEILEGFERGARESVQEDGGEVIAAFGTVPSSIDSIPAASSAAVEGGTTPKHRSGFFGALSEEGLAMTLTSPHGGTKTKFDVPYSRVNVLRGSKTSSQEASSESSSDGEQPKSTTPAPEAPLAQETAHATGKK